MLSYHVPMAHLTTAAWVARTSRARVQRRSRVLIMVTVEVMMMMVAAGGRRKHSPSSPVWAYL